jgi:hypothetical protein
VFGKYIIAYRKAQRGNGARVEPAVIAANVEVGNA